MTRAPSSSSSARSSAAPGASRPRREVRTRWSAPEPANQRETRPPSAPVPPVTITVPLVFHDVSSELSGACTSLRPKTPDPRMATWSSSPIPASTVARRSSARLSMPVLVPCRPGRSTTPPYRSACSRPTTYPTPHTWVCAGSTTPSERPVDTAPRVATHSGAVIPASPNDCTTTTVAEAGASSATSDSTPSTSPTALRAAVRVSRSVPGATGTRTISRPRSASPSTTSAWPSPSTSQRPDAGAVPRSVSGCQVTR